MLVGLTWIRCPVLQSDLLCFSEQSDMLRFVNPVGDFMHLSKMQISARTRRALAILVILCRSSSVHLESLGTGLSSGCTRTQGVRADPARCTRAEGVPA